MSLRAKCDAGTRCPAQDSANSFQSLFGLSAQGFWNANLPCGELHFHGQPPLFLFRAVTLERLGLYSISMQHEMLCKPPVKQFYVSGCLSCEPSGVNGKMVAETGPPLFSFRILFAAAASIWLLISAPSSSINPVI
jgi:hypothetical protein